MSQPRRVLLISNNYFPLYAKAGEGVRALGGTEAFILSYSEAMLEAGHSIAIAATDESDFSLFEQKYPGRFDFIPLGAVSRCSNDDKFSWKHYERFCDKLIAGEYGKFDFIVNNNTTSSIVIRKLIDECNQNGTIVLSIMHRESTRMGSYIIGAALAEAIQKTNGRYMLVANSDFTRKNWEQFSDSVVVYLGTKTFKGPVAPERKGPGTALFIGRISPEKAPHVPMMAALNRYRRGEPQTWVDPEAELAVLNPADYTQIEEVLDLEIIGNTASQPKVVNEYCNAWVDFHKPLADKFHWHGHMPYEQHVQLQASRDVFLVHSTIMLESFGLVVTEAMSVGTPCVVRDMGNLPYFMAKGEVIEDNEWFTATTVGVVVKSKGRGDVKYIQGFRKAIQFMSANLHLYPRQALIDHHAEHYTMERMVENYFTLVDDIRAGKVTVSDRTREVKGKDKQGNVTFTTVPYPEVTWNRS